MLNNSATTVVQFGNTLAQLPSIGKDMDYVTVIFENGIYRIAQQEDVETINATARDNTVQTKPRKRGVRKQLKANDNQL